MTGLEVAAAAAGRTVARRAGREWLAARAADSDRGKDLTELIRVSFPDRFARRKVERQLADIADSVERRLTPLIEQEYGGLSDEDRAAALAEAERALGMMDLSDETLFAADADPVKLARRVRALVPAPAGQLGEAATRLYDVALDECCDCLVRIVLGLAEFTPRALAETLARLSDLGDRIAVALDRIPARSLDAPSGTRDDAEFERRYLEHLGRTLDEIELFGLRVENYRPRATLSVAYISLTATAEDRVRDDGGPLKMAALTGDRADREPSTAPAESMLARSSRTLLRGQAGSGKSTLLGWIAVTAARGAFTGDLRDWNGRVPFLIKLRSWSDGPLPQPEDLVAGPLGGLAPAGWAHRVLDTGRGILLIDGVDEVPYGRRETLRRWLRELLDVYPSVRTIITSRPAAADSRWLTGEGFRPVMLEPMTPDNLRELVRQWHEAVRHAGNLPCAPEDLPAYEGGLLARLEGGPHLRALATTPLLAAMLCALNLDRVTHLPRDRMGLYRAVLDLLLERRDVERGIRSHPGIVLEREQKERLLQELAWRLTVLGRAELSRTTALRRVEARAEAMPRVAATAEEILDYLIQRSGVIREPVPGRIDFVHRTVQEYLAARQAADDADIETLVTKAHLDQWRETVLMAAGHANGPLRRELLTGLLDRAEAEPRYGHRLRMLVAACLETIPDVPRESKDRVERCVSRLIPPRNAAEARRLASAGEEILRRLPESLEGLPEAQAVATVRTAWLVNGPRALEILSHYATDPRPRVQEELVTAWDYFEPGEYAERVLADAPLLEGKLRIRNPRLLPALGPLRHLTWLAASLPPGVALDSLAGVPALKQVQAHVSSEALPLLAEHPSLEAIWLSVEGTVDDMSPLTAFPALKVLYLYPDRLGVDLGFLSLLPRLRGLGLSGLDEQHDFSHLVAQPGLLDLSLQGCQSLTDDVLKPFRELDLLYLEGARLGDRYWHEVAGYHPKLTHLDVRAEERVTDLAGIARLPLSSLQLLDCPRLTDLSPLSGLGKLKMLGLSGPSIRDLSPLAGLSALRQLLLQGAAVDVDLAPLTGLRNLRISLGEGQQARGSERLHRTVKIVRF
ncbi:NACHT domain-containing protein [Actinoallomurus sp. CA-142502]|uniref:NACHT domain-containing protein n=1 Tax=Actinoallomurus sp. CA-142502 TaxID=3239885 RepID=UPI003D8B7715